MAQEKGSLQSHFFAVIVSDLDQSISWYKEILGYEEINKLVSEERGFSQANLKVGDNALELIELNSAIDPAQSISGFNEKSKLLGFFKVGFMVESFDKWADHLKGKKAINARDIVTDPNTGMRMCIVLDPDGNRIQIFESE